LYLKVLLRDRWLKTGSHYVDELVIGPHDLTTETRIMGYPEGSQAGLMSIPVSTSGLGSGPMLANVAFPD